MTNYLYVRPNGGPWAADDSDVALDGFILPDTGGLRTAAPGIGPTVDGINTGKPKRKSRHERRMRWPRDDRKTRGKVVH